MSAASKNARRQWGDLPSELLTVIAEKLQEMPDQRRFRSVCSTWEAVPQTRLPMQIPWLHLPYSPSGESRYFYSLSEDRIYELPLSDGLGSSLFGCGSGDLLSFKGIRPTSAMLLNPFTRTSQQLPSLLDVEPSPSYSGANRFVWDISSSTVLIMDLCLDGSELFYAHPGDHLWSRVNRQVNKLISSIACHNQKFYVLTEYTCETTVLDGETLDLLFEIPSPAPVQGNNSTGRLVKSSSGLLLLVAPSNRSNWSFRDCLQFCKVFRLNCDDNVLEWMEVPDIGNCAIFMDLSHGFMVEVPQNSRIKKNCIYFAQNEEPRLCIFNLEDRSYKNLDGGLNGVLDGTSNTLSPCWLVPN